MLATTSKKFTNQNSIRKSDNNIHKNLLLKLSERGLNPGTHILRIKTPLPTIHGEFKTLNRYSSERKWKIIQ
jgi:hypothetical protein